jgi:hypothetical protein
MSFFDIFRRKSSSDVVNDEMKKLVPVLFPGGHEQILATGRTIAGLLDYRIKPEEASRIYASTKYLAYTAKDKSKERIVAYLVSKGLGKLSNDEASEIFDRFIAEQSKPKTRPVPEQSSGDTLFVNANLEGKEYLLQNKQRSMRMSALMFTALLLGLRSAGWRGANELFEPTGNVMKPLSGRYAIAQRDAIELAELMYQMSSSADLPSEQQPPFVSEFIQFAREGAFYVIA